MNIGTIGLIGAFAARGFSLLSHRLFPLIPAYLAQLTGSSPNELTGEQTNSQRIRLLGNAVAIVISIALVFTLLGASAKLVGELFNNNQQIIGRSTRLIIIFLGLQNLGIVKFPWLMREAVVDLVKAHQTSKGIWGSFIMRSANFVGWTPCIGPFLELAGQAQTIWIGKGLLAVFTVGLGAPFIITPLLLDQPLENNLLGSIRRYLLQLNAASDGLLIVTCLMVITGNLIVL